jgi:solute carrier family 45 protein 1/2/4
MFAVGGPLFQDQFKLQSSEVSIILAVVGPVSGILVQPLIGAWSDRFRSRHGRRRPFILAGSLSCAVGMLLVAFSKLIGIACGDDETGTTSPSHTFGIAFAILGFVWMNICANVVQGPRCVCFACVVCLFC